MTIYTAEEAETQFFELIERAARGEEVIIARGDKPVMRLTAVTEPAGEKSGRRPGAYKGIVPDFPDSFFFDPLPEDELKLWYEGYEGDPLNQPAEEKPCAASANKPKREPGGFEGQIVIHDSFYEPMTEEELREFEEGHPGDPLRLPPGGRSGEASS